MVKGRCPQWHSILTLSSRSLELQKTTPCTIILCKQGGRGGTLGKVLVKKKPKALKHPVECSRWLLGAAGVQEAPVLQFQA